MSRRVTVEVPLNRVEGDLEVTAQVEEGVLVEARCAGTMYRGIENLLPGRRPLDSLVITPRICGICTTSHLIAAAQALEAVAGVRPPAEAVRLRNACLLAEQIQNDLRQTFLMYTVDFVNPAHVKQLHFDEAVRRYQPFQGETVVQVLRQTRPLLEIIATIGGQWPHAAHVVPGGVVSRPKANELVACQLRVREFRHWYETRILGCSVDRWQAVHSLEDLEEWLEESPQHRQSDLGFFWNYSLALGLNKTGAGPGLYLSFGSLDSPERRGQVVPAGFVRGQQPPEALDLSRVREEVACSWYSDYDGGLHPFEGQTRPQAEGMEARKYSWAKAPRYDGLPAETGALAEAMVGAHPLLTDLVRRWGPNGMVRQLARLIRTAGVLTHLESWLSTGNDAPYYEPPGEIPDGRGAGVLQAARGALGHWLSVRDGAITHYQVVTPTAWNLSPRDGRGVPGPLEQAMLGVKVPDPDNPIELAHVVRSFDPCLVCTVHLVSRGRSLARQALGVGP